MQVELDIAEKWEFSHAFGDLQCANLQVELWKLRNLQKRNKSYY